MNVGRVSEGAAALQSYWGLLRAAVACVVGGALKEPGRRRVLRRERPAEHMRRTPERRPGTADRAAAGTAGAAATAAALGGAGAVAATRSWTLRLKTAFPAAVTTVAVRLKGGYRVDRVDLREEAARRSVVVELVAYGAVGACEDHRRCVPV